MLNGDSFDLAAREYDFKATLSAWYLLGSTLFLVSRVSVQCCKFEAKYAFGMLVQKQICFVVP